MYSIAEGVDFDTCDDVAIIGAGISGSYAAYRLREKGWKVSLYEYSNRIGGRIHTVKLPGIPDVNVELGATGWRQRSMILSMAFHKPSPDLCNYKKGSIFRSPHVHT